MIDEHERKIEEEKHKSFPDEGCIAHWERQIVNFKNQIKKAVGKLGR